MLREWNPRTFFRRLSTESLTLLERWSSGAIHAQGGGPRYEQFHRAWIALQEGDRVELETALAPLHDLSTLEARPYLEDLARAAWAEQEPELLTASEGWPVQDLALRLFVSDPERFVRAHQSYAIDRMEHFREFRGRGPFQGEPRPEAVLLMKEAMARHFRERGSKVVVEDFSSPEKFAVFVYQEDEVRPVDRFNEEGGLEPEWHRPVIRVAGIFQYEGSTLLVKAARAAQREKLRDLFAEFLIGDASYFEDHTVRPKFCFDPLRDSAFDFPTRSGDHVDAVTVVRVVVKPDFYPARRIVIDVPAGLQLEGLRALLAEHGVSLAHEAIEGVHLRFQFEGLGRAKYRTVSLRNPNSSNLRDTARDRLIRRYLREWGFDAEPRRSFPDKMGSAVIAA